MDAEPAEPVNSFRDLRVWRDGIRLVTECYRVTRTFPTDERFGLVNQMRRAAVSIPANVAEGWGRQSTKDYLQFLAIANGSLAEVETHLEIAVNFVFCPMRRTKLCGKISTASVACSTGTVSCFKRSFSSHLPNS